VLKGELCCDFLRRIRITDDSEELCQVGIERVHRCIGEGDISAGRSGGRYSARWASSQCADRHRRRELFEFLNLEEESTE
jgi:hypothetical protein